jgi:hypothetical protein
MSCPQNEPSKCEYDQKRDTCKTPNAWIQHLVKYGKQGFTMAQIRAKYKRNLSAQAKCTVVKQNLRDRRLRLGDDQRHFLLVQLAGERRVRPSTILNRIAYELEHTYKIAPVQWNHNWLTPQILRTILKVVDNHLAGGDLTRYFTTGGRSMQLTVVDLPHVPANAWATPPNFAPYLGDPATGPNQYRIVFNKTHWWEGGYKKYSYDIQAGHQSTLRFNNILESMVATVLHEICHSINQSGGLADDDVDDHGPSWKKISRNFWGFAGQYTSRQDRTNVIEID